MESFEINNLIKEVNIGMSKNSQSKSSLELGINDTLPFFFGLSFQIDTPNYINLFSQSFVKSKIRKNRDYVYPIKILRGLHILNNIKNQIEKKWKRSLEYR